VRALYQAVKPDPAALEFAGRVACVSALAEAIRTRLNPNPPDIAPVMGRIGLVLDESITGHEIREAGPGPLDLSRLDFAALAERFAGYAASKHRNTDLEVLKAATRARLEKMVRANRTRADFAEKFEALIDSYNAGSRSIEELFEELLSLSCEWRSEPAEIWRRSGTGGFVLRNFS
jgi:type I restriction enzyme R subunit